MLDSMLRNDAVQHLGGTAKTAAALGITSGAVRQWGRYVPEASALRLHIHTFGKLQFDPTVYARRRARKHALLSKSARKSWAARRSAIPEAGL